VGEKKNKIVKFVIILSVTFFMFSLVVIPNQVFADDLRKNNGGETKITYGTKTWKPCTQSSSWYKYIINKTPVSARGGHHKLSDEQAKKYGLYKNDNSSSNSSKKSKSKSKYKLKSVPISKIKLSKNGSVSSSIAYKTTKKYLVKLKNGKAKFSKKNIENAKKLNKGKGFVSLSNLDNLKRARKAIGLIADNTIPTAKRTALTFNPTGWTNARVKILGSNLWFYNRTHLLGFQLSGLNNEKRNLITGAVHMNTPTMLKYENQIRKFVDNTDNAVLYEVTPMYKGKELVARGLQLRAKSIDFGKRDNKKLEFNYYLYNTNPGWRINYKTGTFKKAS
jgi:DNA-entry nuclease